VGVQPVPVVDVEAEGKELAMKSQEMMLLLAAVTWSACQPAAWSQRPDSPTPETVITIDLVFSEGSWSIAPDGVKVLPCASPNPVVDQTALDAVLRVKDEAGTVVLERLLRNPRVKLIEEEPLEEGAEAESPELLAETLVTLRLPAESGMKILEFFDPTEAESFDPAVKDSARRALAEMEPSVVVDLGDALRSYEADVRAAELAPCREFDYQPDQRKKPD